MVKMKVEKEMELPELLRWASDNDIKGCKINGDQGSNVFFNKNGWVSMNYFISLEENFEVEVEEEITEETKIPVLVEVAKINESSEDILIYYYRGISISEATNNIIASKSFYMLNDNYTMTLIWRNGEMVE